MKKIGDISHHQKTSLINWAVFAKQFDLLFIRVQYGSSGPDREYANHANNATKNGVPFYSYAFPRFVSVDDARIEASDAVKRQHANSLGMVVDIESEYDEKRNPSGITKLSKDVRLEGIKSYVAELRKKGCKRVGAYVGHNVYEPWGIAGIIDLFDFVWIPRYGSNKPAYPCDIWQNTESGKVDGYDGNVDLNVLISDKTLDWFIGKEAAPAPDQAIGVLKVLEHTVLRKDASASSPIIRNIDAGDYVVHEYKNGWYQIGGWVNSKYVQFIPHADVKMTKE